MATVVSLPALVWWKLLQIHNTFSLGTEQDFESCLNLVQMPFPNISVTEDLTSLMENVFLQ